MKESINSLLDNAFTNFKGFTDASEEQHKAIQDNISQIADILLKQLETA